MDLKDVCLHRLWVVERYLQWVTDPKSIRGLDAFRQFALGEITKEELAKVSKDTLEAAREAEETLIDSEKNRRAQAAMLAEKQEWMGEDRAYAWSQAVSKSDVSFERARLLMAKAVHSVVSRRDTLDVVAETVAQAAAELAYAEAANATAKTIMDEGKLPHHAWRIWVAAAEAGFATERAAQKLEWLRLVRWAEAEGTTAFV
jgi:hypothetical protein